MGEPKKKVKAVVKPKVDLISGRKIDESSLVKLINANLLVKNVEYLDALSTILLKFQEYNSNVK